MCIGAAVLVSSDVQMDSDENFLLSVLAHARAKKKKKCLFGERHLFSQAFERQQWGSTI